MAPCSSTSLVMTKKRSPKLNEDKNKEHKLMIPKILMLIVPYFPLFGRHFEAGCFSFVDTWDPRPLLRAAAICKTWRQTFTPVLCQTYDLAFMEKNVHLDVLHRNNHLVRNPSLLDKKHKKHAALWDALTNHKHIKKLEIHDAFFPVKRFIGPMNHDLEELKLSGNCKRMHPFLFILVEKQVHQKSLELTRFNFTASDWKRIISNKPHLRKVVIAQQCEFIDHKSGEDQDDNVDAKDSSLSKNNTTTGINTSTNNNNNPTTPAGNTVASNEGTTSGRSKKRKNNDNDGDKNDDGRNGPKKHRRTKLVNTKLPDAKNIGVLSATYLILRDNRLLLPFQKAILEACPHLEQLEIRYSQKVKGSKVATLVRDNCRKLRRLTLKSTRQPWTLAVIDGIPHTVEELILDFGRDTKGKRRLACILSILRECTELKELSYHNHAEDKVFKEMMFRKAWNLPNLRKLHIHGVSPPAKYNGIPKVSSPEGWRQQYGCRKDHCCNARSFEEVCKQGKALKSPLSDVALLEHVEDLPNLLEVVITEAIYRKELD
ncbi:hypothetical protein BGZ47_009208 [Haplosporangium gracile]|nr:hypothetical protein BGZ47_009208 [Haplosporangium gracile]